MMARRSKTVDLYTDPPIAHEIVPKSGLPLRVLAPHHSTSRKHVYYDFTFAAPMGELARVFAKEFLNFTEPLKPGGSRTRFTQLRAFLRETVLVQPDVVEVSTWGADRWKAVEQQFSRNVSRRNIKDRSKKDLCYGSAAFLKHLQDAGVLPTFEFSEPVKVTNAGKIPPISHLPVDSKMLEALSPAMKSAVHDLESLADVRDPIKMQEKISRMRDLLREHWTEKARAVWTRFVDGNRLADNDEDFDVDRFLAEYSLDGGRSFHGSWRDELSSDTQIIKLVKGRYGGIIPARGEEGSQLGDYIRQIGAARRISPILHSTVDSIVPFYGLLLNAGELALNPSSAKTMTEDSSSSTDSPGLQTVYWDKGRISETFSEHCYVEGAAGEMTVPQAQSCLQAMSAPLRPYAVEEEEKSLFLVKTLSSTRETIGVISDDALIKGWKRSLKSHPFLSVYKILPMHLRSSHLYHKFLQTGGDVIEVHKLARHAWLETSQIYVNLNTSEFVAARDARQVQDFLLMKATPTRQQLHQKLGLDAAVAKRLTVSAASLGFMGWDLDCGEQDRLSEFERWLINGEKVFIETVEVAAELYAFRNHLVDNAHVLRETKDWSETWAPMILLMNAALGEMKADTRNKGSKLAAEYELEYKGFDR
ncbi:hypothetical protein JOH50_004715 [Rhizobium leguminosarum]|uniref:hypothetical protein n=1 Tax=Rhizobium leguminosarum TaxID=384 RepID=UPI001AE8656C|nr:hypothetical protein [Rhizobium leguminosarum]MBP2488988.1 hypothetical protein [Rhizobium leguminosarum]